MTRVTRETRTFAVEMVVDADHPRGVPEPPDIRAAVIDGFDIAKWPGVVEVRCSYLEGGRTASHPTPTKGDTHE